MGFEKIMKEIKVSIQTYNIKTDFLVLRNVIIELRYSLQVCKMSFKKTEHRISKREDGSFYIHNHEE